MQKSVPLRRVGRARLIIADDHELARAGLRSMLADEPDLEIVGEAKNGLEAVNLCQRFRPDLVLMDVRMPQLDGFSATMTITGEYPATRVVIVTIHDKPDYLFEALKAGAAGYLLKDATRQEILSAVRRVLRGEILLHPDLAARALRHLACGIGQDGATVDRLTPRELEVLRLLAQGKTNREIADQLTVSVGTVKVHVEHILSKLGVADRTQAAVRAIELGLLDMDLR